MTEVDGPSSFAELQEKNLSTPQPGLEWDVAHVIGSRSEMPPGGRCARQVPVELGRGGPSSGLALRIPLNSRAVLWRCVAKDYKKGTLIHPVTLFFVIHRLEVLRLSHSLSFLPHSLLPRSRNHRFLYTLSLFTHTHLHGLSQSRIASQFVQSFHQSRNNQLHSFKPF